MRSRCYVFQLEDIIVSFRLIFHFTILFPTGLSCEKHCQGRKALRTLHKARYLIICCASFASAQLQRWHSCQNQFLLTSSPSISFTLFFTHAHTLTHTHTHTHSRHLWPDAGKKSLWHISLYKYQLSPLQTLIVSMCVRVCVCFSACVCEGHLLPPPKITARRSGSLPWQGLRLVSGSVSDSDSVCVSANVNEN